MDITVPEGTKALRSEHVSNLKCGKNIVIPEGIEEISFKTFSGFGLQTIVFPSTLKKIGSFAFQDCHKLEEVILPEGLEVIEDFAFNGCCKLTYAALPSTLKTIGDYAFQTQRLTRCDTFKRIMLPASITEIGKNAFGYDDYLVENKVQWYAPKNSIAAKYAEANNLDFIDREIFAGALIGAPAMEKTPPYDEKSMISIEKEMPFYSSAIAAITEKERDIQNKKKQLSDLTSKLSEADKKIQMHGSSAPDKGQIQKLSVKLAYVMNKQNESKIRFCKYIDDLERNIAEMENQIHSLINERKNCFFLEVLKKKKYDYEIEQKQNELQLLRNKLDDLKEQSGQSQREIFCEIESIKEKINSLEIKQCQWDARNAQLAKERMDIQQDETSLSTEIATLEENLKSEKATLENKHQKWLNDRNAEIQRIEKRKREEAKLREKQWFESMEKKSILNTLVMPKFEKIPTYEYFERFSVAEEVLLNKAFLNLINALNESNEAEHHNCFVSSNARKIERVKEINRALGCQEDDGIESLHPKEKKVISGSYLPGRFVKLAKRFAAPDSWERFKHSVSDVIQVEEKHIKNNLYDVFFSGVDYFTLSNEEQRLLVFPYCMVIYEAGKQLCVLTYDEMQISVEYSDKEEITDTVSKFGEVIRERYQHLNKDGSVSRRYKYNPIIKTVRYTNIVIDTKTDGFQFPVETYQNALRLEKIFSDYCYDTTAGLMENVYGLVLRSADPRDIEAAIDNLAAEEVRCREITAQKEDEEKQRIEAERKAALLAAAERKQAIIQHQRELNEERRRQSEEKKKALQLFEDDFSVQKSGDTEKQTAHIKTYFSVVGNMTVSNNVFKVVVKQEAEFDAKEFVVSFALENGKVISNKKKLVSGDVGCETKLGFVLDSGIDYTQMKKCFMKIATSDDEVQNIEFKMNIAFYSDF